jgi:hypothetical protein
LSHTIKVHTAQGSQYFVSKSQANSMVTESEAHWIGASDLREHPKLGTGGKLGQWRKTPSGPYRLPVMQLV